MELCYLMHSELAEHLQKYKARVVIRGDNVKDDTGCQAASAEQGASASQVAASRVLDTLHRQLGMAGDVNDAVSANTQVEMKDAPRFLKLLERECSTIWIRLLRIRRRWPSGSLLESNLHGHPLTGLLVETQFGRKVNSWECRHFFEQYRWFLSENVDHINMVGCKLSMAPMWARLRKKIELENSTPLVDQAEQILGCTLEKKASAQSTEDTI